MDLIISNEIRLVCSAHNVQFAHLASNSLPNNVVNNYGFMEITGSLHDRPLHTHPLRRISNATS